MSPTEPVSLLLLLLQSPRPDPPFTNFRPSQDLSQLEVEIQVSLAWDPQRLSQDGCLECRAPIPARLSLLYLPEPPPLPWMLQGLNLGLLSVTGSRVCGMRWATCFRWLWGRVMWSSREPDSRGTETRGL